MRWLSRAKSLPVLTGFSVVVTIPSLPGRGRPGNPECPRHIPGACPTPESGIGARNDQPTSARGGHRSLWTAFALVSSVGVPSNTTRPAPERPKVALVAFNAPKGPFGASNAPKATLGRWSAHVLREVLTGQSGPRSDQLGGCAF